MTDMRGRRITTPWNAAGVGSRVRVLAAAGVGLVCIATAAPGAVLPPLHADHPRLGLRPEGTPGARTVAVVRELFQHDETFRQYFSPALERAQSALEQAEAGEPARRDPDLYAACWVATGEARFADPAIDGLLNGSISLTHESRYYSNVWCHALAYDWLYHHPTMTPARREQMEERIAATVVEELVELDGDYPAVWHGRNQLANNTFVAALSLSVHPRRAELQERAAEHFADAIRALAMTQGWPEGPSYWIYNRAFPYALAADCFITATGETTIAGIDVRETMRQIAYWQLYALRPDATFVRYGDCWNGGLPRGPGLWQPVQDYYARLAQDPGVTASAEYFRGRCGRAYHGGRFGWSTVLTYDPKLPMPADYDPRRPEDYLNDHLPRSRVFGRDSLGEVFLFERWGDPDATWISFKAGDVLAHHGHYDQGSFTIFRGSPLAVHSGSYSDYLSDYRLGYFIQTVAKNSLLVHAPGEFSNYARASSLRYFSEVTGGQRVIIPAGCIIVSVSDWRRNRHAGVHYEAGDILSFQSVSGSFDYIEADITEAYNSTRYTAPGNPTKVDSVVRKFVYLRRPNAVIVLDRVVTTDPAYVTRWLLHTPAKPVSEAETQVEGSSVEGILRTDQRWFRAEYERGVLFHQVLLPPQATILKIGGPSYRHYTWLESGGANLEPRRSRSEPERYGLWRTEVVADQMTREHIFLNVIWPRLASEPTPEAARTIPADPPALALAVGDWAVVMAAQGRLPSVFSYHAPVGTTDHLITGLWPRSAWLVSSAEGEEHLIASAEGVLSFRRGDGTIRLSGVPPRNGRGHM